MYIITFKQINPQKEEEINYFIKKLNKKYFDLFKYILNMNEICFELVLFLKLFVDIFLIDNISTIYVFLSIIIYTICIYNIYLKYYVNINIDDDNNMIARRRFRNNFE